MSYLKRNRALTESLVFAAVGMAGEVLFTAATEAPRKRDPKLQGYTYAWMAPVYATVPFFLRRLLPRVGHWPAYGRLPLYTALIYAAEFASGAILRRTVGECPWECNYRRSRWAVRGLIRLDYAPAWAFGAWVYEQLYLALRDGMLENRGAGARASGEKRLPSQSASARRTLHFMLPEHLRRASESDQIQKRFPEDVVEHRPDYLNRAA